MVLSKFARRNAVPKATQAGTSKYAKTYPDMQVIVFHLQGQAVADEPGLQMLFITVEGYPEHVIKQTIYDKHAPNNQAFHDSLNIVKWDFTLGQVHTNEIKNKRNHLRHCLAKHMYPEEFGEPASGSVYSKEEIKAWIIGTYIPAVTALSQWKGEGPHCRHEDWYQPVSHLCDILDPENISNLLKRAFCSPPTEFALNTKALFQSEKTVLYATYPLGKLTKEFVTTYSLKREHVLPQDYDKITEGPMDKFVSPSKLPAKADDTQGAPTSTTPANASAATDAAATPGATMTLAEDKAGTTAATTTLAEDNDGTPADTTGKATAITPGTITVKIEKGVDTDNAKRALELLSQSSGEADGDKPEANGDKPEPEVPEPKKQKAGQKTTGLTDDEQSECHSNVIKSDSDDSLFYSANTSTATSARYNEPILTQLSVSSETSLTQASQNEEGNITVTKEAPKKNKTVKKTTKAKTSNKKKESKVAGEQS